MVEEQDANRSASYHPTSCRGCGLWAIYECLVKHGQDSALKKCMEGEQEASQILQPNFSHISQESRVSEPQ